MNALPTRLFLLAGLFAVVTAATATAGLVYDPVVTTIGASGATLSSAGFVTSIYIYQDTIAGQAAPISSTAYASGASSPRLVTSGTSTSEGNLANNPGVSDAAAIGTFYSGTQYVYNAGYDAAAGTLAVAGATAAAPRSFGQTNVTNESASGATVLQTQSNATAYNNSSIRSAVGDDTGSAKYTGGTQGAAGTGGWRNFATNTILSANPTNARSVELLGGKLFGSTGSNTGAGIGLQLIDPTGGSAATLYIGTGSGANTASPYEFALFDDPNLSVALNMGYDTAYIADDGAASAQTAPAGIQKWTWNGAAWALQYTLKDTGLTQYRGLAGQLDADTGLITLFASVEDATTSKLQQVTDGGALSPFITLASLTKATDGLIFRGVALATVVPEPTAFLFGTLVCGVIGLGVGGRRLVAKLSSRG